MIEKFDEDYFLRGQEKGVSLYKDYRWLPDLTIPMAKRIIEHLGVKPGDTMSDFGCSRGYLVRAMIELGVSAVGVDISEWAIKNCDESVKSRVVLGTHPIHADWIVSKDVCEHIEFAQLSLSLNLMARAAAKGVFIVVPLAGRDGRYVVPEYEQDVTHIVRWNLKDWVSEVHEAFDVEGCWEISARHRIEGIKDNYAHYPRGNGFITCRRI